LKRQSSAGSREKPRRRIFGKKQRITLLNFNHTWLVVSTYPSEKYEFVSWDDDIPKIWKNNQNVPNHQPDTHMQPMVLEYAHQHDCPT